METSKAIKHGDIVEVITKNYHMMGNMNPDSSTNRFIAIYNARDNVYHPLIEDSYFAIGTYITDVISAKAVAPKKSWILGNGEMIESL